MSLHFVLTDRDLEERYPHRSNVNGRFARAGALVVGWPSAGLFAPSGALLVALIAALASKDRQATATAVRAPGRPAGRMMER